MENFISTNNLKMGFISKSKMRRQRAPQVLYNLSMLKPNQQHKNYTKFNRQYQPFLLSIIETLIPADDSVRLLSQTLEGLNYEKLYKAFSKIGRKPAVEPKIMFKVLVYAYLNNIYSSRKIERTCKRDINFIWLLGGNKVPDHSTIARFRKDFLSDAVEDLFYQLVKYLHHLGEIKFENLFIDGTKIEANANRYTFVWRKTVNKNGAKMFIKVHALIESINMTYETNFIIDKDSFLDDIKAVLDYTEKRIVEDRVEFVYGSGKRKSKLQKFNEELKTVYERQLQYDMHNRLFDKRNSYSKTDPDATFMRMKDDHMRNSQLKPGYNVQIGVESEYVTRVGVFQDRSDTTTFIPFLNEMRSNLERTYQNVIADSRYESEENYLYLEEKEQKYYIKPQTYKKWKKKNFKKDISKRENMKYDEEKDEYTCHNGKQLKPTGISHRTSSKLGILLRINRSIQVEGAFGVLKNDYQFNRFLTRGKSSVKNEFILLCLAYNVNKLHSKIKNKRCGRHLHYKKVA